MVKCIGVRVVKNVKIMSEQKQTHKYYFAAGVFKIDYRAAGYAQLREIAEEWAKDPNFYLLMVRGVSEKNFGIEFIYWAEIEDNEDPTFLGVKKYREELITKFGKNEGKPGFYAWDYESGFYESDNGMNKPESLVVYKPLI